MVDLLLERGDRVWVLDDLSTGSWSNLARWNAHPGLQRIECDITDGLFERLGVEPGTADCPFDAVVHLAARVSVVTSLEDPLGDVHTNARGTVQVLELARRAHIPKVVFASSAAVYGDVAQVPTPENAPLAPLSPYGVNKLTGEHFMRMYAEVHRVGTSALRFFNVYGERQDPSSPYSGVISIFADRARRGQPLTIYGDGSQTRDFIYVGDVVRSLCAALDRPGSTEPVNVATGRAVSVKRLAEEVVRVFGPEATIDHAAARRGEILHSQAAVTSLRDTFGVTAQTELASGLERMRSGGMAVEGADPSHARVSQ